MLIKSVIKAQGRRFIIVILPLLKEIDCRCIWLIINLLLTKCSFLCLKSCVNLEPKKINYEQ